MTYDLIKEALIKSLLMTGKMRMQKNHSKLQTVKNIYSWFPPKDDLPCHFTSAFGAGFCTTVIASPVDVVKTRYMNSAQGQYSSALNCAVAMLTKEGPKAFYKGSVLFTHYTISLLMIWGWMLKWRLFVFFRFMPSFLRLGSWNVVMFVTYEQLKRALMAARHNWATPV